MLQGNKKRVICLPTLEELKGLQKYLPAQVISKYKWYITGIGSFATSFHLMKIFSDDNPDILFHMGIAGTYTEAISIGEVVQVRSILPAEFGIEKADGRFLTYHNIVPSLHKNSKPFQNEIINNPTPPLPSLYQATELTVPYTSGHASTVERRKKSNCDIESMEGLGLFYTCVNVGCTFHTIRGISNVVEVRNRSSWNMNLALENIANVIIEHLG